MKLSTVVTIIVALHLSLAALPALANSLTYTVPTAEEPGKFAGELPIARIGTVALPDGLVRFAGDEMLIEAVPEWLFDREQVLKGVIVRAEVASRQEKSVVAGLVFFTEGAWLPNLAPGHNNEEITTNAGELICGRISGRSGQSFLVQTGKGPARTISFKDIGSMKSARAFSFNIPTPTAKISPTDSSLSFESNLITLSPSRSRTSFAARSATVPASKLAGTDPGISNRAIGTFVALDLVSEIAPAITIPLVLNPMTQKHALKQINDALHDQLGLPPSQ
jgi:hypothetical protein